MYMVASSFPWPTHWLLSIEVPFLHDQMLFFWTFWYSNSSDLLTRYSCPACLLPIQSLQCFWSGHSKHANPFVHFLCFLSMTHSPPSPHPLPPLSISHSPSPNIHILSAIPHTCCTPSQPCFFTICFFTCYSAFLLSILIFYPRLISINPFSMKTLGGGEGSSYPPWPLALLILAFSQYFMQD